MPPTLMPPMLLTMGLLILTHCTITAKKYNMTLNTDAPDNYPPDFSDDGAASPDYLILYSSLRCKIDPKSMLKLKN